MRIGLAGAGHWHAAMHIDAVVHAGATMVGAWDEHGVVDAAVRVGVPAVSSLEGLIALRPDLIVVMGHPAAVPRVVRACIDAHVPIVLEKPAAPSTADLEVLNEHAIHRDHFVAVPFANRCSPLWRELQTLQSAARLGAISHAQFRIINGPPERYRADGVGWMLDPAVGGGGALRNLGLHCVDAALALCGDPDLAVAGAQVRSTLYGEAVEEYAIATLTVPGGAVVTVEAGYTFASMQPGGEFEWRVSAAGATIVDRGATCRVHTLDDGVARDLVAVPPSQRYRLFMADTLDRLGRGAPPSVTLGDYARAMRVVDRIYAAAQQ